MRSITSTRRRVPHVPNQAAQKADPTTVNIVTRDNGVGLTTDIELLSGLLEQLGYDVEFVPWRSRSMRPCAVAIFLELWNRHLTRYARNVVGVFNPEWFQPGWFRTMDVTQIWAKSGEALRVFEQRSLPVTYTGFLSRDLHDPGVPREATCLHLRGNSSMKGTAEVLEAWSAYPELPPLTVISAVNLKVPANVELLPRLPAEELQRRMNAASIHVCPSRAEGWGHYITEALSTGASVITTDASPMNEHVQSGWGFLVPVDHAGRTHVAADNRVTPAGIADAVRAAVALDPTTRTARSALARRKFEERNAECRRIVAKLMKEMN